MKTRILLEKREYLLKLIQLFQEKEELEIIEIKKRVPVATYYRLLLIKLVEINEALSDSTPEYFIKPYFVKRGNRVYSTLKKHPNISIHIKERFIVLEYEDKQ